MHGMPPGLAVLVRLVAVALWAALVPASGLAHAVLQSTSPQDGALLAAAPDEAVLAFNEAVGPLVIRLIGPDGSGADLTQATQGGSELRVPLGDLGRGTHVLSWRVVSDDGHPVAGALVFSVGEVTGGAAGLAKAAPGVRPALWLARFAMTAGLVIGVGGACFAALTGRPLRDPRLAAVGGLVAAPLFLGLHGLDALGLGFPALLTAAPWVAAWGTSFGPSVVLAALAALLALARGRVAAFAALALLGVAYAASGHAGAAHPRWLTRPMVFVHLVTLTFWIGALIPLARGLRRADGAGALGRFSAAIPHAVALLLVSGIVLAVVQLGRDPALWLTAYGYILAAKLALVAVLLLLAAWNRWGLTAGALAGDARAAARMRRSIAAELVLALAILGLTAGWRFVPPPRALAPAVAAPAAEAHLHGPDAAALVTVSPGATGPVLVRIEVADAQAQPLQPIAVTLSLANPAQGIERIARDAVPETAADPAWRIDDLILPLAGAWEIEVEIRLDRFRLTRLTGSLDIP